MSEKEGDEVRRELLQTISRLSDKHPNLRITQLLGNAHGSHGGADLYYVEDSQLLGWLLKYETKPDLTEMTRRGQPKGETGEYPSKVL